MKKRLRKKMNKDWEWYAVKVLYACIISEERSQETMDIASPRDHKTFEETLFLIEAPSEEQAYAFCKKEVIKQEVDYLNVYGQKVEWKFIETIDCFNLFNRQLQTGTELYSRFLYVPDTISTEEVI
ncbi:DUF4288 domain-containing protein [Planococcus sp. YIM B11945]|uniref:DUF4288 domain-containing protein n=1 Tax=Planococcus sp. YIM B11945 TaxID=3435410 RepID=UPI003D7E9240